MNSSSDDQKHEIKHDKNGMTHITNVTALKIDPNDTKQLEDIMEIAATNRSVAATAMNEHSSRSHSCFTLYLTVRIVCHVKGAAAQLRQAKPFLIGGSSSYFHCCLPQFGKSFLVGTTINKLNVLWPCMWHQSNHSGKQWPTSRCPSWMFESCGFGRI